MLPASPASAVPVLPPTFTPGIAAGFAYAVSTLNTIISFIVWAVRAEIACPSVPPPRLKVETVPFGARASVATYGAGTAPAFASVIAVLDALGAFVHRAELLAAAAHRFQSA